MTWSPSLTLTSRSGSKTKPRTPHLPTSGWDCATPACWSSGSGSVTRPSTIRTGPHLVKTMTVTCLEPWTEEGNISGSVILMKQSITSYALSVKTSLVFGGVFLLSVLTLCLFSGFILFQTKQLQSTVELLNMFMVE